VDLIISGMIGTERRANERPVSIIPRHINSIVCGRPKIWEGPKNNKASEVVKRADKVIYRFSSIFLQIAPTIGPKKT
jgi:hypothetical protein